MTSRIAKTWTIGCCAFALVAFTDAAQAQRPPYAQGPYYPSGPFSGGILWPGFQQLPSCSEVGQTVTLPLTLNTGTGGPLGTADPIWMVAGAGAYSTESIWFPNNAPIANWIQPAAGGTWKKFAQGTYVYQTQFATPVHPYFYDSIKVTGNFGADDKATIKLNGNPIAECGDPCFYSPPTPISGAEASNWRNFTQVTTGWVSTYYVNTLTVEVTNTPNIDTPSGLFVEATVTAVCSKCTSPLPPPVPQCSNPNCL
jgi:hypothetical protein